MFDWSQKFSLGIESVDAQHKKLFEIGKELYNLLVKKSIDKHDEIEKILKDLEEYSKYHFKFEEDLFIMANIPDIEEHKKEHDEFIERIVEISKMDIKTGQNRINIEMLTFVAHWIENHILLTDSKYKEYLNNN
jgi:hemerythrin